MSKSLAILRGTARRLKNGGAGALLEPSSSATTVGRLGLSSIRSHPQRFYSATTMEESSPFDEFFDQAVQGIASSGTTQYQPRQSVVLECGIPEDELTFKSTSYGRLYLAPYVKPHEHKVTMSVHWSLLPLNELEKEILEQIVASRLNKDTMELRLQSDQFGSRIENKRHLVSMLDRLIFAARRLAKEATTTDDNNIMEEAQSKE